MPVSPVQCSVAQGLGEAPEWQVILTAAPDRTIEPMTVGMVMRRLKTLWALLQS